MRILVFSIILFATACGTEEHDFFEARYIFPAAQETGRSIILHNGHVINGQGSWSAQMTRIAEILAANNYTVYRVEMPPTPHGPESDFFSDSQQLVDKLNNDGQKIYMIGLSGGGWTTTMMTAMDSRILRGYSVAGDIPSEFNVEKGDYEKNHPPIEYEKAYELAGSRLFHIYNWGDTCCYSYVTGDIGIPYVTDYTSSTHQINHWTIKYIIEDLKNY